LADQPSTTLRATTRSTSAAVSKHDAMSAPVFVDVLWTLHNELPERFAAEPPPSHQPRTSKEFRS
jgi:hypothetical protein